MQSNNEIISIFYNALISVPGIVQIHSLDFDEHKNDPCEEINSKKDCTLDFLQAELVDGVYKFKCCISVIYGLPVKNIVNQIRKQIKFNFNKQRKIKFELSVYIKGVHYE